MAVNIIKEHEGIRGTNIIEHHRNPSGRINKAKWLLKQSHRDINKINEIISKIVTDDYDKFSSWVIAKMMAVEIMKYGFKDWREYITAVRERKIYNKENKDVND